jgi:cob(I)alamin adenosyltransferase
MKVYTRTGDDGTTALFGGDRVSKSHPRIDAYGTVDEANAAIGVVRSLLVDESEASLADEILGRVQSELFVLGGDLASPGETKYAVPRIEPHHVESLEADIDRMEQDVTPLKHFVLPGGSKAAAALHVARTVTRRAERQTVLLAADEPVSDDAIHYLNRLSDMLFVMARWVNAAGGTPETIWAPLARRS